MHDYSTMVERILRGLGATRLRRVVVTAGEPLGQGPRVAALAAEAGHEVVYTPDMSVARVIAGVDGFITGVESFYLDGSFANTVGTVMLGLLCRESGVPVLAPAETLKCDHEHSSVTDVPLTARLLRGWPRDGRLPDIDSDNVVQFVLDAVPASLVTTYVTETGVGGPGDIGDLVRRATLQLGDARHARGDDRRPFWTAPGDRPAARDDSS